MKQYDKFR